MNAHLEKMHAAKRAAEAAKREQYRKDAVAYREWLKRESLAFSRRIAISRDLTRSSDEFRQADRSTRTGNQYHVTHGRYGQRVDTYRTQSAAQYAARLLNSNLADLHPHAVIGARVWSRA